MTDHFYAAIMAGGGGTRLWPLSRRATPKQSLRLVGQQSLFEMAVNRIRPIIPIDRTLILTVREQQQQLMEQVPDLVEENFIIEPGPRGTASAIGLAAIHLRQQNPQAVMACLTADHFITEEQSFRDLMLAAHDLAQAGYLVTLGIPPSSADTGYGYIHRGQALSEPTRPTAYQVRTFTEKPDLERAQVYLKSGEYLWNSGMFVWRVQEILEEIKRQIPDLYSCLERIEASLGATSDHSELEQEWMELKNITVDYGVMEGANNVAVLPADDLGWVDIGDWGRLYDVLPQDEDGNVLSADETQIFDTSGALIFQDKASSNRLIAAMGLDDMIIIDTGDVLLVCHQSRSADLKQIVDRLRNSGLDRYL